MFKQDRINKLRGELEALVGPGNVRTDEAEILMYSYDAGMARARPEAVIIFDSPAQVAPAVELLYKAGIPFVPRLAGTNLSGGTIPLKGGVILNLCRLNRIRQIDTAARLAVVEPGVVNLDLQKALAPFGYFYAPDPASQKVSTIGGNIGENAGGPLCLKYGVTSDNVEKLEVVTPEGKVRTWSYRDEGPDLMSLLTGSEGTLGIVTRAWLKILPLPRYIRTMSAAFPSLEAAMAAVTAIIADGIVPRALEAMDRLSLDAALSGKNNPFPPQTEAALIIELDGGDAVRLKRELSSVEAFCLSNGCVDFRLAADEAERELLWSARKGAYPALARLAPDVLVEDGVVPRPKLPEALRATRDILSQYKINAGLLFHAGDGNLHPNMVFDRRDLQEVKRVKKAGHEILKACIRLGGTVSGEHGVGVEKRVAMNWLYGPDELEFLGKIKKAFDPAGLANPDKILPVAGDKPANSAGPSDRSRLSPEARSIIDELVLRSRGGAPSAVISHGTRLRRDSLPEGVRPLELHALAGEPLLDKANLTVRVEAGVPVEKLREILRASDLDLELPEMKGSVGGLLAAKAWPGLRSLLLGLELASADGTYLDFGSRTVKNVAGYDVPGLFCGSMGAYGVILAATLAVSAKARRHQSSADSHVSRAKFEPDEYHARLKREFDPRNLLNPWIYGGAVTQP